MSVGDKEPEGADGADAPQPGQQQPEPAPQPAAADGEPGATPVAAEVQPTPEQRRIAELEAELAAARQSSDQSMARLRTVSKAYTELQTEMKSFRERMEQRAKLDTELQAYDQVRAFFDPVMNLKRSLSASGDSSSLREGLGMVLHQFMEALHKLGLREVPGVGSKFDPNVHEALGLTPVTDPAQDGIVLVVHTTGFAVGSRVLQAAQVVIGKYEEAAGEA
jgi:molecular chaperone GrpE